MIWDAVLALVAIIPVVLIYLRWNYSRFKDSKIPHVEPSLIFGNFKEMVTGQSSLGSLIERYHEMFPGEPAVGLYIMRTPLLLIRDLDLVKSVMVTNFNNFRDNGMDIDKRWKEFRRKHTLNHTTNKLKTLFRFVEEVKSELIVEKLPIYAIQRDPEYFEDPEKFNPARFLDESKPLPVLTFGAGPRACFGQRFAKTQIKAGVAHLVKNFCISPGGDHYSMPTVQKSKTILLSPGEPMIIKFSKL